MPKDYNVPRSSTPHTPTRRRPEPGRPAHRGYEPYTSPSRGLAPAFEHTIAPDSIEHVGPLFGGRHSNGGMGHNTGPNLHQALADPWNDPEFRLANCNPYRNPFIANGLSPHKPSPYYGGNRMDVDNPKTPPPKKVMFKGYQHSVVYYGLNDEPRSPPKIKLTNRLKEAHVPTPTQSSSLFENRLPPRAVTPTPMVRTVTRKSTSRTPLSQKPVDDNQKRVNGWVI